MRDEPEQPTIILTVDRPGPEGAVFVMDDTEREAMLPGAWFSRRPREGEVFRLRLLPDDELRRDRAEKTAALISQLETDDSDQTL
jgi:hypothetical protein